MTRKHIIGLFILQIVLIIIAIVLVLTKDSSYLDIAAVIGAAVLLIVQFKCL